MSGSGSRGWISTPPRDVCSTLTFRVTLNSPQPAVLAQLAAGALLTVSIAPLPQTAVYLLHNQQIAGSLTGQKIISLINCIQNGYQFEAEVISVLGGLCTVDVRPA